MRLPPEPQGDLAVGEVVLGAEARFVLRHRHPQLHGGGLAEPVEPRLGLAEERGRRALQRRACLDELVLHPAQVLGRGAARGAETRVAPVVRLGRSGVVEAGDGEIVVGTYPGDPLDEWYERR